MFIGEISRMVSASVNLETGHRPQPWGQDIRQQGQKKDQPEKKSPREHQSSRQAPKREGASVPEWTPMTH